MTAWAGPAHDGASRGTGSVRCRGPQRPPGTRFWRAVSGPDWLESRAARRCGGLASVEPVSAARRTLALVRLLSERGVPGNPWVNGHLALGRWPARDRKDAAATITRRVIHRSSW